MGLFRRREPTGGEQEPVPASPVLIDPSSVDLEEADAVLTALASAVGSRPLMDAALPRLVVASGCPHPDDDFVQRQALLKDPFMPTRVWRWILAVMLRANQVKRYDISAKAVFWVNVWDETVAPTAEGSTFVLVGFDRAPRDTLSELLSAGTDALTQLPGDFVVARTAEPKVITARHVLFGHPEP